jgi:uncharacterized protein YraI
MKKIIATMLIMITMAWAYAEYFAYNQGKIYAGPFESYQQCIDYTLRSERVLDCRRVK